MPSRTRTEAACLKAAFDNLRYEPAHFRHLRVASQRLLAAIQREHPERRRVEPHHA